MFKVRELNGPRVSKELSGNAAKVLGGLILSAATAFGWDLSVEDAAQIAGAVIFLEGLLGYWRRRREAQQ